MQDLLDAQISAVVLIPLLLGCFALWRCSQWIGQSSEVRRVEYMRLSRKAQQEEDRLERLERERSYGGHHEYLPPQRQGAPQRQVGDYRVEYRSQPVSGYDYPRRARVEEDYRYADFHNYLRREDEESLRRRRWAEERRQAEAEEFQRRQAEELNWRRQAEAEEFRRKQAHAEEAERKEREAADAEIRRRLDEEAESIRIVAEEEARRRRVEEEEGRRRRAEEEEARRRRVEEEEGRRRRAEEEEGRRRRVEEEEGRRRQAEEEDRKRIQAAVDESNRRAEAEAQARKLAEEEEVRKNKPEEIDQKGTEGDVGTKIDTKVPPASKNTCAFCQKQTKRRCSRCKSVFYCSRECQIQHWHQGHKFNCHTVQVGSSSSPASSEGGGRKLSDLLSPRSTRSDVGSDEIVAPSLSPSISPAPTRDTPSPTPAISHSAPVSPLPGSLLKTSSIASADWRRMKPKKVLFPYDDFVELFNSDIKFIPCGLFNCGNSCFANAVLQCLTYTQPLVAYLLRGDHGVYCRTSGWCFMCALQEHAIKARQSRSPFSPVDIVSQLRNIGKGLSYGNQEDAHEFMSYATHSMQSICLAGVGGEKAVDASTQETTLIHHIFGGLLQSQVRCMECRHQSNVYEIMMDLAVEIQGNVGSLEEALRQFTAPEILDGENKYKCDRCDAYVAARKQITMHEAPNILTVTLKRFKAGKFGKLSKRVSFPEYLDMTPFMSKDGDRPPPYSLYAVVVHVDVDESNATNYGHYICLVKNPNDRWYQVDDAKVTEVDIYAVTSQQAYMLFYKRSNSRPMGSTESNHNQASSSVAQDWSMANGYAMQSQPPQFNPLHMYPLAYSTRTDRTDTMHVPIGISSCYG